MPRPKLQSDDAVLDAASAILLERGLADFTLADVAQRVGLSRAALIQRFDNKDGLLRRVAHREVQLTRDYLAGLPRQPGFEGLTSFLHTIVHSMGDGSDFGMRAQLAWAESRDPELRDLAGQRYALVQEAIASRLPPSSLPAAEMAAHLHAIIAGATMQWLAEDHPNLADYVTVRLDNALRLAFPKA